METYLQAKDMETDFDLLTWDYINLVFIFQCQGISVIVGDSFSEKGDFFLE